MSSTTTTQPQDYELIHSHALGKPRPNRKDKRNTKIGTNRAVKKKGNGKNKRLVESTGGVIKEVLVLDLFVKEYLTNGGNALQAIRTLFPKKSASESIQLSSYYMTEARRTGVFRALIEKKGYSLDKMIDVALEKMDQGIKPDWWDRLMRMSGYEDFTASGRTAVTVNTNIFEAHRGLSRSYVEAEVIEEDDNNNDD